MNRTIVLKFGNDNPLEPKFERQLDYNVHWYVGVLDQNEPVLHDEHQAAYDNISGRWNDADQQQGHEQRQSTVMNDQPNSVHQVS